MGKIGRIVAILVLAVLVAGLVLAGCSKPQTSPAPAPTSKAAVAPAPAPKSSVAPAPKSSAAPAPAPGKKTARIPFDQQELPKYAVGGNSPGGSGQLFSTAWANIISKYTPIKGSVTLIPSFAATVEPVRRGEVDFWWLAAAQPWAGYSTGFPKDKIQKIRVRHGVSPGGKIPNASPIFVLKNSDFKEIKDLKGKRIGVRPAVIQTPQIVEGAMKSIGLTKSDYTQVDFVTHTDAYASLVERKIDAFCSPAGTDSLEIDKTVGLRTIPLDKVAIDTIIKINPALTAGMTPANYMGMHESQLQILSESGFWLRADLNEKGAYTMVKALFEHIADFHAVHQRATDINLETAAHLLWTVPYHPGVIRYYKEKGVWKDEHTAKQKNMIKREIEIYGSLVESDAEAFKELGVMP